MAGGRAVPSGSSQPSSRAASPVSASKDSKTAWSLSIWVPIVIFGIVAVSLAVTQPDPSLPRLTLLGSAAIYLVTLISTFLTWWVINLALDVLSKYA
jgi:hypothetical protein